MTPIAESTVEDDELLPKLISGEQWVEDAQRVLKCKGL